MKNFKVPDGAQIRLLERFPAVPTHHHNLWYRNKPVVVRCDLPCLVCQMIERIQMTRWQRFRSDIISFFKRVRRRFR